MLNKIMLKMFRDLLELLIILLNKVYNNTLNTKGMQIVKVENHVKGRFKTFTIINPGLKEGKELLQAIFITLTNDSRFIEFGYNKIIILSAVINGQEYSYHHNVLINNLTSFQTYWNSVKDSIKGNFGEGYGVSVISLLKVKVWNGDELKNKHIKITSKAVIGEIVNNLITSNNITNYFYGGYKIDSFNRVLKCSPAYYRYLSTNTRSNKFLIKPYSEKRIEKLSNTIIGNLASSDLETMEIDGVQVPVLITYVNKFEKRSFLIDHLLLKVDKELALKKFTASPSSLRRGGRAEEKLF